MSAPALLAIARHEAGHVLAYALAGVRLDSCSIDLDQLGHGVTVPRAEQFVIQPFDLWRLVAVAVAGVAAEYPGDACSASVALDSQPDDLRDAMHGATKWLDHGGNRWSDGVRRERFSIGVDERGLVEHVLEAVCALYQHPHVARSLDRLAARLLAQGALTGAEATQAAQCSRWRLRPGAMMDAAVHAVLGVRS